MNYVSEQNMQEILDGIARKIGQGSSGAGLEDWQAEKEYNYNDICVYEGQIYRAKVGFTGDTTFSTIQILEEYTPIGGETIIPYEKDTEISIDDIVSYDNNTYKALYNFVCGEEFSLYALEEYVPQELTSADIEELVNAFSPSGGGSQGGGNNYKQILLYDIIAPYDSELDIATTEDFCLPPVEVLKFQTTEQDVTKNIFSFEVQDGSSFVIDGVSADKNHFVAFDGKVHLNTSYEIAFGEPTDIGDYDICESEAIKISDYKSIGGLV